MNFGKISKLRLREDGVWTCARGDTVSFPKHGNAERRAFEEGSFWYQHRNLCLASVLARFPPSGPLLDIGGGNGTVTKSVQDTGIPVALLEPEQEAVREAQRQGVRSVACSTFNEAGFEPRSLSAAGLFDVLEHMPAERDFLRVLRESLEDRGRLYITVPAYSMLWAASDVVAGHCRRYTLGALKEALEASGFGLLYQTYFFSALMVPVLALRSIPWRLGLGREGGTKRHRLHKKSWTMSGRLLLAAHAWEGGAISKGRYIPTGTSCLVAAEKTCS